MAQVVNHAAVVRFSLRGPGQPGPRPVSAPLADPTAVPAMQHQAGADEALRHVVHALLVGVEDKQAGDRPLRVRDGDRTAGAALNCTDGGGAGRARPADGAPLNPKPYTLSTASRPPP